jgi:hypothetical protein
MRRILLLLIFLILSPGNPTSAQERTPTRQARATSFRIHPPSPYGGVLYITVAGKERRIADGPVDAWLVNDGAQVVYSGLDGAGGFENEGMSLRVYDVRTGRIRKVLSEYFGVDAVMFVKTSNARSALLVKMADGGLGGSYFAVVDPNRGEVFFRRWAELTKIDSDRITLAFYGEEDWDAINESRRTGEPSQVIPPLPNVKPQKTETHDLKQVLTNRVIYNKPTNEGVTPYRPRVKEVKIYLWKPNDDSKDSLGLFPVNRLVEAEAPLDATLRALFAGATDKEEQQGFSDSTFGMKFEGVTLRNGLAIVRFSQPKGQTNYGSLGPSIFAEAIERSSRQFPTVKKVQVCAVGETLIDSQLEKPFPRCSR